MRFAHGQRAATDADGERDGGAGGEHRSEPWHDDLRGRVGNVHGDTGQRQRRPTYVWKKNSVVVGGSGNTYLDPGYNGDEIDCQLTSNANCASPTTANAPQLTLTVNATVTQAVSIGANPGTTICAGTSVTFTATPVNGGGGAASVSNSVVVGGSGNTYTDAGLANGDKIDCQLTFQCQLRLAHHGQRAATDADGERDGGAGGEHRSESSHDDLRGHVGDVRGRRRVNGGGSPTYVWKRNSVVVGGSGNTYTDAGLANGDKIDCQLTSNANCASPTTANAPQLTLTVNATVAPAVSIGANPGTTVRARR